MMKPFFCVGCERKRIGLKSRCLMQTRGGLWNLHCSQCCCLNKRRGRPCDDPSGLGWVKK